MTSMSIVYVEVPIFNFLSSLTEKKGEVLKSAHNLCLCQCVVPLQLLTMTFGVKVMPQGCLNI